MVDVDDSKEVTSKEDLTDAVVTEDDNSEEAKSDVNDNTDDDSQEGISDCDNLLTYDINEMSLIHFDTRSEIENSFEKCVWLNNMKETVK